MTDSDYYLNGKMPYIEIATLMKEIDLTKFSSVDYIEAPFFIPIFAALYTGGDPITNKTGSPNIKGFKGDSLNANSITKTNYIYLKIPKYIINQFPLYNDSINRKYIIPKDTKFLISSVGGQMLPENIRIIGLWDIGTKGGTVKV